MRGPHQQIMHKLVLHSPMCSSTVNIQLRRKRLYIIRQKIDYHKQMTQESALGLDNESSSSLITSTALSADGRS